MGARGVAVGMPYDEPCTRAVGDFLENTGHEVLSLVSDEPAVGATVNDYTEAVLEALAERAWSPKAEALFLSCTALPTRPLIGRLAARFGVPVLTDVHVTIRAELRSSGVPPNIDAQGLFRAAATMA